MPNRTEALEGKKPNLILNEPAEPCLLHTPDSPICILAVDDLPANLIALEAALKDCHYKLVTANSGLEAIEQAQKYEFAAILLDVQMPNLDGFETAKLIRHHGRGKHTPIIFLTAIHHDEHYAHKGYQIGAVDYIYKPLNVDMLKAKLEVFAELFRQRKLIEFQADQQRAVAKRETDQKIAEINRTNQARYQDLVEGIKNGIVWSSSPDGIHNTFISPQVETILGYPASKFLTEPGFAIKIIPEEDRKKFELAIARAVVEGAAALEHRMIRADGEIVWFQCNIRLGETPHGPELRGLCVDVTKLKKTEESLRNMIHVRDEFLSIASHELKTPLTPLQLQVEGFMRLFSQGRIKEVPESILKQMLETSSAQVSIMVRLVEQLLDVSRITSGKVTLNLEEVDLVNCLNNVVSLFNDDLIQRSISLKLDHPKSIVGHWDRLRLEQVLINLLNNAIRYGDGKGISITVSKMHSLVQIVVEDQGIGIAPKDQERIFGRFERAVSANSFSGLGLGLYITKEIVELHGGNIRVESELGRGSKFIVTIPAAKQH